MKSNVQDAVWIPCDDTDLIQRHEALRDAFTQAVKEGGFVYSSGENCHGLARGALKERCEPARRYILKKCRERTAKLQRLLTEAVTLFAGACVLALLVG